MADTETTKTEEKAAPSVPDYDPKHTFTVKALSEHLGYDRDTTYNLICFLEGIGLARKVGTEKVEKGRGSNVYAYEPGMAKKLATVLDQIELVRERSN